MVTITQEAVDQVILAAFGPMPGRPPSGPQTPARDARGLSLEWFHVAHYEPWLSMYAFNADEIAVMSFL